jgi:hypothetical protein
MCSFWEPDVKPVFHFHFQPFAVGKAANEDRDCCSSLNNKHEQDKEHEQNK